MTSNKAHLNSPYIQGNKEQQQHKKYGGDINPRAARPYFQRGVAKIPDSIFQAALRFVYGRVFVVFDKKDFPRLRNQRRYYRNQQDGEKEIYRPI